MTKQHICPWWFAYTFETPLRKFQTPPDEVLKPYLKEGMTFVDFGCGMGYFSIKGSQIVGKKGKVISVDVQTEMLEILKKNATKAGVIDIITPHLAQTNNINLNIKADFALAMWMVHETPDFKIFFTQVKEILNEGSNFLVVEPFFHVSKDTVEEEIEAAKSAGFQFEGYKKIGLLNHGFVLRA